MAEQKGPNNVNFSSSSAATAKSPDSDVSPRSQAPSKPDNYFPTVVGPPRELGDGVTADVARRDGASKALAAPGSGGTSTAPSTVTSGSVGYDESTDSRRPSYNGSDRPHAVSRKSSSASVAFRSPRNPSLPQGFPRKTDNRRLRESSPSPVRFRQHVGFDNVPAGEATKNNTSSLTLHVRHQGYQPSRRSRTFMVGVDEHAYSDYALVWLLNNMVDDGDEVVCVRVLESPPKSGEKNYQEDAKRLLQTIQSKNELNKAISIILEYSVGKLHTTFQQLLQIHQPSMLIVGTKGRSLGGIQGLMNTRNSFSKYCLQYSPVPVVVVRPDDKRLKKKEKRSHDPHRHTYVSMLAHNDGKHEADSEASSVFEMEKGISPDEEAHRVAAAIGLPAAFDPTIKAYHAQMPLARYSTSSAVASPSSGGTPSVSPPPATAQESGDEESGDDDDDDYEIEAVSPQTMLQTGQKQAVIDQEQKKRLHAMEVGEAAALLKSTMIEDEDEDEESQERTAENTRKA